MKKTKLVILLLVSLIFVTVNVKALTIEEVIESKEITVKSSPPSSEHEFYTMVEEPLDEKLEGGMKNHNFVNCNATYTLCDLEQYGNPVTTGITINYDYDKAVKMAVDSIIEKIPEDGKIFLVEDVEALKWVRDDVYYEGDPEDPEDVISPIRYSSEYNNFIGYYNFDFEPRLGDLPTLFAEYTGGGAEFKYDGVIYGNVPGIGVRVNKIVYVNNDEADENIAAALKTRLSKYFDNITSVFEDDEMSIEEMLNEELNSYRDEYNTCTEQKAWLDTEKAYLDSVADGDRDEAYTERLQHYEYVLNIEFNCSVLDEYETLADYEASILEMFKDSAHDIGMWNFVNNENMLPNPYIIKFDDDITVPVVVIKDSSKVITNDLKITTKDSRTGVSVSTTGLVPLDTLIQVARLTSGEAYNKIVGILNKENIEMFDIKLFSKSTSDYITKLGDGSFEVRLPISESLQGKQLSVYYVDANDKVETMTVTLSDDGKFAIFNTNHFSVYTLGEKDETEEETPTIPDIPTASSENEKENNTTTETNQPKEETKTEESKEESKTIDDTKNNPQTYDNVMIYVMILGLSIIGLISAKLILVRIKK